MEKKLSNHFEILKFNFNFSIALRANVIDFIDRVANCFFFRCEKISHILPIILFPSFVNI